MSNKQDATWNQATHTLSLINQQQPSLRTLTMLHDGYLTDLVQAIEAQSIPTRDELRNFLGLIPLKFSFAVDFSESQREIIGRGNYEYVDDKAYDISFSSTTTGPIVGELIPIDLNFIETPQDAERILERKGLRRPTFPELLVFGNKYPEVEIKFCLRVIGLIGNDWSKMPWLCGGVKGHDLFNPPGPTWRILNVGVNDLLEPDEVTNCRLLGIRKVN